MKAKIKDVLFALFNDAAINVMMLFVFAVSSLFTFIVMFFYPWHIATFICSIVMFFVVLSDFKKGKSNGK